MGEHESSLKKRDTRKWLKVVELTKLRCATSLRATRMRMRTNVIGSVRRESRARHKTLANLHFHMESKDKEETVCQ